mmetsp:Transcript_14489/g.41327  ORF Transcript_14489/g.41327 Transcript_14489/m.41327 type:complete len:339 (+) Transcript_14489:74-1090(+)|eukprot:CAMPEP_0179280910 /NCGR_PEP_ID=MMETSP0797-20121207/36873_1 /TAXON_ID=47934 /ORGANISM="Dinophysis acuminata, Strain DAEP01" /LENGTH=338 /DNA_ID=CAMNT_0020989585 /DNA_START=71 /DNA_END=1087 /DNA_ORIENTATION=-
MGHSCLWLLVALVARLGEGQLRDEVVTLRWHGDYHKRFSVLRAQPKSPFPLNVCRFGVAMCLDIRLNECVRGPDEFRFLHDYTIVNGTVEATHAPREHGGGYFLLTYNRFTGGPDTFLTLWSNCSEGCEACGASTGMAKIPLNLNYCGLTPDHKVYSVMSPSSDTNCVPSLGVYYEQLGEDLMVVDAVRFWALGSIVLVTCVVSVIFFMFYSRWLKRRVLMHAAGAAEDSASTIDKLRIDQHFPAMTMASGGEELTCVVCLVDIEVGQEFRRLQCNHCFHTECIDNWWLHRPRVVLECPLCKRVQSLEEGRQAQAVPEPEVVGNASHAADGERDVVEV